MLFVAIVVIVTHFNFCNEEEGKTYTKDLGHYILHRWLLKLLLRLLLKLLLRWLLRLLLK